MGKSRRDGRCRSQLLDTVQTGKLGYSYIAAFKNEICLLEIYSLQDASCRLKRLLETHMPCQEDKDGIEDLRLTQALKQIREEQRDQVSFYLQ